MRFDMQPSSWRLAATQALSADMSAAGACALVNTPATNIANHMRFIETLPQGAALRCGNPNHGMQYLRNGAGFKWRKSPIGVGVAPTLHCGPQSDGYYTISRFLDGLRRLADALEFSLFRAEELS
jgi:hypothetical protein